MIAGSKPSVNEDVIRYQARTKLATLASEIAAIRRVNGPDAEPKIKKAKMIRLWLKALDYKAYLSREQREKIWYALIHIAGINDFPISPLLELRNRPNILQTGIGTTTIVTDSGSSGGGAGISFTNTDVDIGTEIVDSFARTLSSGARWVCVARKNDGSANMQIEGGASWLPDGSDLEYTFESTLMAGSAEPDDVVLSVVHNSGDIELRATATSNDWTVEGYRNHIPSASGVSTTNSLPVGNIVVGNPQNIATASDTISLGDILADVTTGLTIKAGVITNNHIDAAAGIVYTKLDLSNSIVNADIATGAGIVYAKLNLTNSIVNADISPTAGIVRTKLANGTANRLLINNGMGVMTDHASITAGRLLVSNASGLPEAISVTTTEAGRLAGVLSPIQDQLDDKAPSASPAFTGNPTAPTQTQGDNSTRLATTAYVDAAVAAVSGTTTTTVVIISSWNMDIVGSKTIAHGITSGLTRIKSVTAKIRDDIGTARYDYLGTSQIGLPADSSVSWDDTNVYLSHSLSTSSYASSIFDSTAFDRGELLIIYES